MIVTDTSMYFPFIHVQQFDLALSQTISVFSVFFPFVEQSKIVTGQQNVSK